MVEAMSSYRAKKSAPILPGKLDAAATLEIPPQPVTILFADCLFETLNLDGGGRPSFLEIERGYTALSQSLAVDVPKLQPKLWKQAQGSNLTLTKDEFYQMLSIASVA